MHDWLDDAMYEACVKLGFCLQGEAADSVYRVHPRTIQNIADAIIVAEGFEVDTCPHRSEMLEVVAKYFEVPVPKRLRREFGDAFVQLYKAGFRVTHANYPNEPSRNFQVEFEKLGIRVQLSRVGGEIKLAGPVARLRALQLDRTLQPSEVGTTMITFAENL